MGILTSKIDGLLTKEEQALFKKLSTPQKIQDFLVTIKPNFEEEGQTLHSPRYVLKHGKAHCIEGALLASAVLSYHGYPPLLLDLKSTKNDFDHVVALFQQDGYWGALSKTNHAVLRYREPIYKTIRELALSYFHEYFTHDGKKTLRSFSKPFSLRRYGTSWITSTEPLYDIGADLDDTHHSPLVPQKLISKLRKADPLEIAAGKLTDYTPPNTKSKEI